MATTYQADPEDGYVRPAAIKRRPTDYKPNEDVSSAPVAGMPKPQRVMAAPTYAAYSAPVAAPSARLNRYGKPEGYQEQSGPVNMVTAINMAGSTRQVTTPPPVASSTTATTAPILPTDAQGSNMYDKQRQQVQAGAEKTRSARMEALQRRLAMQGISDSGIALKLAQMTEGEVGQEAATQMGAIDQAQLGQEFAAGEAGKQRTWQSGESGAQRAWQSGESAFERELSRETTDKGLSVREKELAQNARQFDSRLDYDKWATQQGYNDKERQRGWDAAQNSEDRAWKTSERVGSAADTQGLARLNNQLQLGTLDYQDLIAGRAEVRKANSTKWYNLGQQVAGGTPLTPAQQTAIDNDPDMRIMYEAGLAGKSQADVEWQLKQKDKYIDGMITQWSNLSPAAFDAKIKPFMASMGITIPGQVKPTDGEVLPDGGENLGSRMYALDGDQKFFIAQKIRAIPFYRRNRIEKAMTAKSREDWNTASLAFNMSPEEADSVWEEANTLIGLSEEYSR